MPKLEFDHDPTQEEIQAALKDVPAWPGSQKSLGDYAHHVLPMKQGKKTGEVWQTIWNLYVLVDGRVRMFTDAHAESERRYSERVEDISFLKEGHHNYLAVRLSIDSELFGRREDVATANLNPP